MLHHRFRRSIASETVASKSVNKPGGACVRALRRQHAYGGLQAWRFSAIAETPPNLVLILFYVCSAAGLRLLPNLTLLQ